MSGKYRFRKSINRLNIKKKDEEILIPGFLGLTIGGLQVVEIPNREGYVYVRLRGDLSETIQAYNDKVSPVYGLPILVIRDKVDRNRYRVVERDLGMYQNWGTSAYLPRHGAQHSFDPHTPGGDIVWVWGRQFMPLAAVPSGSYGGPNVIVEEAIYYQNSSWKFSGGTGTASFLPYKPTGTFARMVLVYVDDVGNPQLEPGTDYFATNLTGSSQVYPYIPLVPNTSAIPVAAVRLVSGTSVITWDNIYDVRPHTVGDGFIPTGTVGHIIQDDGVPLANRDALNFVGSGFVVYNTAGATNVSGTASGVYNPNRVLYTDNSGISTDFRLFKFFQRSAFRPNLVIGGFGDVVSAGDLYNIVSIRDSSDSGSEGTGSYSRNYAAFRYATISEGAEFVFYRGLGNEASPNPLLSGTHLGAIRWYGYVTGASNWQELASFNARSLESTSEAWGTALEFYAGQTGTNTRPLALFITSTRAKFNGLVEVPSNNGYYWGQFNVTGTWRSIIANERVEFQMLTPVGWETRGFSSTGTAGTGSGHTIEDEGTPLTQRTGLNFVGGMFVVYDNAGGDETVVSGTVTTLNANTDVLMVQVFS